MSKILIFILSVLGLSACQQLPPIKPVPQVELDRFMGDWYVIAAIPTVIERDPYNPVERYQKNSDGSIATVFTFRQGGFNGPLKRYQPTGFIVPGSGNAEWRMQFVWPFKSEYLIAYLSEDYQYTIIARNQRDYVWLMARQPHLDSKTYSEMVSRVLALGYDTSLLQAFPHEK